MNLWKAVGLAGLAGVAAAGVIIAREQRQRTQLGPEEIRARLHERLEAASTAPSGADGAPPAPTCTVAEAPVSPSTCRQWLTRHRRRRAASVE